MRRAPLGSTGRRVFFVDGTVLRRTLYGMVTTYTARLDIRLTPRELRALRLAAKAAGMSLSAYARRKLTSKES